MTRKPSVIGHHYKKKILPSDIRFRLQNISAQLLKITSNGHMIKIDQRNVLEAKKRVNKVFLYRLKVFYISEKVLLFAQSLVVHIQLAAQVRNVLIKSL